MALRLGDLVVAGEFFNTRRYSVHGRLLLRGPGEDKTIMVELTGATAEDLAGWNFRFEPGEPPGDYDPEEHVDLSEDSPVARHQIGPTGTFTAAHSVRIPGRPADEKHRCLYLEWFGQNGRTVIELVDPIIEFVERAAWAGGPEQQEIPHEPAAAEESPPSTLGITEIRIDDDGEAHVSEIDPSDVDGKGASEDNPYGLAFPQLESELQAEAWRIDQQISEGEPKSKDLRELELMDDLIENDPGVSLLEVFDEVLRVPRPENLSEGPEAEAALRVVLAQMALYGIQLSICDHFTPLQAYRLLIEEIAPETCVFPQLRGTQWVQGHSTDESCPLCEEEFERKYRSRTKPEGETDTPGAGPG